jgi:hypothetical protein
MSSTRRRSRRNLQPKIEAMAAQGVSSRTIACHLDCSLSYVERVRGLAHTASELTNRDPSTPKFAQDDDHVAMAMEQGGFCALSERRGVQGNVFVCLPLVWPMDSARALAERHAA